RWSAPSPATTPSSSSPVNPPRHRPPAPSSRPSSPAGPRGTPTENPEPFRETDKEGSTMSERVILAYSGGLDTSEAIPYLAQRTGAEVIAVAVDVGQGGESMDVIRKRALACGAIEAEVIDARDEFAADFCLPAVQANALYMDRYPLLSSLSRPLIV